ncbi:MAG: LysR family transcriptional regulator [Burkholderiales bacterium]|nr:LysR family transcriptional regulator [Burkholderiales bacterium]MDE1929264.1 LysR family transcriptional regulator [Burkholderiales bacterium]MDE2159576.1 LysR family transcriptional regulator [Burkholderiales bacterium]MDE2503416.1 LysR family transcriptional regulator [Burkholderiales bacterium]
MIERVSEEITFRKLEILLAYMQAGSLARAAELMDVSSVSIHRALHSLEAALRCQLFRHEGRNLVPTQASQVLADVAREVLNLMSEGVQATRRAGGYSSDLLRLGSLYSLTTATVPQVIMDLKLRSPQLQAELVLGSNADLLLKLRQGEIDAALVAVPEADADIESIALFEDDIYFAAPAGSKYAALAAVDLRLCADERFVSLGDGFVTYAGFVDAFRVARFTPKVVMKVGDIFSLMNLVSGGVGCTLLPGRVRDVFKDKVQLIPLLPEYLMRQTIGLNFLRTRERDPNLLALASVCRLLHRPSSPR